MRNLNYWSVGVDHVGNSNGIECFVGFIGIIKQLLLGITILTNDMS